MPEVFYSAPRDLEDWLMAATTDGSFRMGFTKQWLDITAVAWKSRVWPNARMSVRQSPVFPCTGNRVGRHIATKLSYKTGSGSNLA
jgi:hypothetical protein